MMRTLCFLLLFWAFAVKAQDFLPATEDIPLMSGLYQVEETATFDSPSEKMTLISALSNEKSEKIQKFYHQVLTNLGWRSVRNNHFTRGHDTLTLELTPMDKKISIQFTLVQKN